MKKILFLIIDMQNGFQNEFTRGLDGRILSFLQQAGQDVLVAGTRYVNHARTACYVFEGWTACMAGDPETEILDSLKPVIPRVFDKDKYSCWNEEMKTFVRENGIEKIYFAGVNTGCCVLHSVFDCYNDLVDCAVIEDLCGSTSGPEEHEAALVVLKSCITPQRVISARQALLEIQSPE
ncbi:MAG: cysteine hydrolase [Clostridiales bacterium]|nr:cysteine hydrolase [Clostridiales bacterium]